MRTRFKINPRCAWVNYVRSHDDIGWTFSDEDAAQLGINGFDHRQFLNAFYTGRFPGSFARGLPFQFNPATKDTRISGSCASLAGLETALREEANTGSQEQQVDLAIRRVLLIHSVMLSIGGIPLIYLGDEIGTPNDYGYRDDPAKADDSRWVHRPVTDWEKIALRKDSHTVEGRIYSGLRRLFESRKENSAFAGGDTEIIDSGNPHILGYVRQYGAQRVLVLASFSENTQQIPANELRLCGLGYSFQDLVTGERVTADEDLIMEPYRFVWLKVV
jgi:amylosucrase